MSEVSTQEEADQRTQAAWAPVPDDLERLAEQCCDEYHGEGGTFQNFVADRQRWRDFATFLWGLGTRPQVIGPAPATDRSVNKKGNETMADELAEVDISVSKSEALSLESNGLRVAKNHPPSVISNQLRDELIRILKTGDDKNAGAFTVAIAAHVEKFAVAAREILMTENLAQNDLASLMMMRKHPHGGFGAIVGSSMGDYMSPMPLPMVNNENFGVQAIKQMIDAARTMTDSPAKLVEALAIARSNNLTDVAATLEAKLGVTKAPPDGEQA